MNLGCNTATNGATCCSVVVLHEGATLQQVATFVASCSRAVLFLMQRTQQLSIRELCCVANTGFFDV
jgi:hypothetical protein